VNIANSANPAIIIFLMVVPLVIKRIITPEKLYPIGAQVGRIICAIGDLSVPGAAVHPAAMFVSEITIHARAGEARAALEAIADAAVDFICGPPNDAGRKRVR
jgi:hypothetical protein